MLRSPARTLSTLLTHIRKHSPAPAAHTQESLHQQERILGRGYEEVLASLRQCAGQHPVSLSFPAHKMACIDTEPGSIQKLIGSCNRMLAGPCA